MGGEMEIQTKMHHGTKMTITIPTEDNESISRSVSAIEFSGPLFGQIELQRDANTPCSRKPTCDYSFNDVDELSTSIVIPLFNSHCWPLRKRPSPKLVMSSKTLSNNLFNGEEIRALSSTAIGESERKEIFNCTCPKVLAVDDNALNLFVIEGIFKRFGIKCDKAFNGSEAIKMVLNANTCVNCHGYDIIFMDCNMPIMNGFDASKTLANMMIRGKIRNIPIVANSAFNENDCVDKCKEAGMSSFSKFLINDST
jgi:CheY-like chemotaxis protein